MLETPSVDQILRLEVSDHCNLLSVSTLNALGIQNSLVSVEATVRRFPGDAASGIFFGMEDVAQIIKDHSVTAWALPDGARFREDEPVLQLVGTASSIAMLRTPLTGVVTFYSSLVTKMVAYVEAALPRKIHFFGLRKIHPSHALQYMLAAYVSGMEIDATRLSHAVAEGLSIADCQEHFTNIVADSVNRAWKAFLDLPSEAGALHVVLDNISDPLEELTQVLSAFGPRIRGVLVDLDATRRGNLPKVLRELRWKLEVLKRADIQIFLTGGVTLEMIRETKALVDGYGVGINVLQTSMLDFSFQIVEVDGTPKSKLGVLSGRKSAFICQGCGSRTLALIDRTVECCGNRLLPALAKFAPNENMFAARIAARERVAVSRVEAPGAM
jgi:nicotinate phosphoribosyltransferase